MITKNQYTKLRALNGCIPIDNNTSKINRNIKIKDACQNKGMVYSRVLLEDKDYIMEVRTKSNVDYISFNDVLYERGLAVALNSDREYHSLEILPDKTYIELYGEHRIDTSGHSNCFCVVKDKFRSYVLIYNNKGYRLETEQAKELSNYCYVYDNEDMTIEIYDNNTKVDVCVKGHDEDDGVIRVNLGEEVELEDIDCGVLYELK